MKSVRKLTVVLLGLALISVGLAANQGDKTNSKDSSSSKDTKASSMFNCAFLDSMQVVDFLRSGSLIVGVLAILFWDRRPETWLQAELVFQLIASFAAFFAPAALLDLETDGSSNEVHEMYLQALGGYGFALSFIWYVSSNDVAVRNLRFVLNSMFGAAILMVHSFAQTKYKNDALHFNMQHCILGLQSMCLIVFGNFVQLYRANKGSSSSSVRAVPNGRLNGHLLFDGFLFVLFGFLDFGFPEFGLSQVAISGFKPDGVLATLGRHAGLLELYFGLQAILYTGVPNDSDKRGLLRSRILMSVVFLPLLALYQWKHAVLAMNDLIFAMVGMGVLGGNALCALYVPGKKKVY